MSETLPGLLNGSDELAPLATLQVELVGDLICPFSYLGKRRLDRALSFVHGPMSVGWYPFQLNPEMPAEGEPFERYLESRFGSPSAIQPVLDRLQAEGRDIGLEYRFDLLTHVPNTLPAHQLIQHVDDCGQDTFPLVEAFMAAYLTRGEDIGDPDVILSIAAEQGIPAQEAHAVIGDTRMREKVLTMEETIRDGGITGVPGFLMNRRLLLIGVQEVSGIIAGFDRAMFGDADGQPVEAPLH